MWMLSQYVNETLANALNSRMSAADKSSLFAASVGNADARPRKLLRSNAEVVKYLLKKFATHQAIAEFDVAIMLYMQKATMTPQQYTYVSVAKPWKLVDVYDKRTFNNVFSKVPIRQFTIVSDAIGLKTLKKIWQTLRFKWNRCCLFR